MSTNIGVKGFEDMNGIKIVLKSYFHVSASSNAVSLSYGIRLILRNQKSLVRTTVSISI